MASAPPSTNYFVDPFSANASAFVKRRAKYKLDKVPLIPQRCRFISKAVLWKGDIVSETNGNTNARDSTAVI